MNIRMTTADSTTTPHVGLSLMVRTTKRAHHRARQRRGLATGWLLIWSPVFLVTILLAIEIGNVLLAKVQLENALEAAALAGVRQWKVSDDLDLARQYAQSYALANSAGGAPVMLQLNDAGPAPNENGLCDGDIVLGAATPTMGDPTQFIFSASASPDPSNDAQFGIRVRKSVSVTPICENLFGLPLGAFEINGDAAAICEGTENLPRLIRISTFVCP